MISAKKSAASRRNGRKSRGPKTPQGKSSTRSNALRHGLSIVSRHNPKFYDDIMQMARAICQYRSDPALFEQAITIAENNLLLRLIQAEKVGVVERYRDPITRKGLNWSAPLAMMKQ